MKNSLILALVSLAAATQAHANPVFAQIEAAPLTSVKLDTETAKKAQNLGVGGTVSINQITQTASFRVQGAPICKPGQACPHFIVSLINSGDLPVVSGTTNACGARIITAARDARPVDGDLQTLVIVDNRLSSCPGPSHSNTTTVTYTVVTAGFGGPSLTLTTTAEGEPLVAEQPAPITPTQPPIHVLAPVSTCSNEGGDGGYRIDNRVTAAEVFENNIAGETQIATLKCKAAPKGPNFPDAIQTSSICKGKGKDGKTYIVSFRSGGLAGGSWADLSAGKTKLAHLGCQFNPQ